MRIRNTFMKSCCRFPKQTNKPSSQQESSITANILHPLPSFPTTTQALGDFISSPRSQDLTASFGQFSVASQRKKPHVWGPACPQSRPSLGIKSVTNEELVNTHSPSFFWFFEKKKQNSEQEMLFNLFEPAFLLYIFLLELGLQHSFRLIHLLFISGPSLFRGLEQLLVQEMSLWCILAGINHYMIQSIELSRFSWSMVNKKTGLTHPSTI